MKIVHQSCRHLIRSWAIVMCLVIGIVSTISLIQAPKTTAVTGSDFMAGRIIDDNVFTNPYDISVPQIQALLNQKMPSCDTYGTQTSEYGGGTRAQYGAAHGNPAPFTCLKDYYEVPKTSPGPAVPANNYGGQPIPDGAVSAAQLIYDAGVQYSISPRVLVVTLQKEQGLVGDDWPFLKQYLYAMGAHCPDSGPNNSANCDTNYAGFSLQVRESAALFRYYLDNMSQPWWSYKKPGNNNILWNPNQGCGSSTVNIETKATAALYTYTPYRPNAAALSNLYGLGDSCSSYGNRNFWRMFNDWFGSTLGSYLLRSPDSATVYLMADDYKFPIGDIDTLNALYPLGGVKFVTQQYLDTKTTGNTLKRLLRGSDGTIYFFDAGIKLPFSSCQMVSHYGMTCGDYVSLNDQEIQMLTKGPLMSQLFGTTSGKVFYVNNGTKRETFDAQARQDNGLTGGYNILNESAIANLAYGQPIMRANTIAHARFTNNYCLYDQQKCISVSDRLIRQTALRNITRASLDAQSMQLVPSGGTLTGFVQNVGRTNSYVLDSNGKAALGSTSTWTSSYTTLSDGLMSLMPNSSQPVNARFVKSVSNGTVYYIDLQKKRTITNWDDLLRLSSNAPVIVTLPDDSVNTIPVGLDVLGPGMLAKYYNSNTVYIINGSQKLAVNSFLITNDLGMTNIVRTVAANVLDSYATESGSLSSLVNCEGKNFAGIRGALYEVSVAAASQYGFTYQTFDAKACLTLPRTGKTLDRFIRLSNGTIYYIENHTKRPITSYQNYVKAGGTSANTVLVSDYFALLIADGASM